MLKRLILLIALLLLVTQAVYGIDAGENYELLVIPFCVDNIIIKVRQQINVDDYFFVDCIKDDKFWNCSCDKEVATKIIFRTNLNATNIYDIVVEYNLDRERRSYTAGNLTPIVVDDDNRRTLNFNNININAKPVEKKKFQLPEVSHVGSLVLTLLVFVIGIFICGSFLIWKLSKQKNNQVIIKSKKVEQKENEDVSYEQVEEMIRNSS